MKSIVIFIISCFMFIGNNVLADNSKFSGKYVGISLNYLEADHVGTEYGRTAYDWIYDMDIEGYSYGAHIGYKRQIKDAPFIKNFLLGIELGIQNNVADREMFGKDLDGSSSNATLQAYKNYVDIQESISLTPTITYVYKDKLALSALGGVQITKVEDTHWFSGAPGGTGGWKDVINWRTGYVLGGGIEFFVYKNISTVLKYTYADFGTDRQGMADFWQAAGTGMDREYTEEKIGIGFNYNF